MNKLLTSAVLLTIGLALFLGCASLQNFLSGSTTNLTSSSLAAAAALRAQGITISGTREGSNWLITPTKISGKILSLVLPVNGQEDEGIVPFGQGRPDIAPAQSTLYDFDLSQVTSLYTPIVGLKPGYSGGTCSQIILLFGYFDVEFLQGSIAKKIRFCYGDTTPYVRGDKLLYNANGAATGKYYWYSTTEGFVSETADRPSNAVANAYVRDFSDPIRPAMHYYMLGAQLRNNTDYDGAVRNTVNLGKNIVEDHVLTFTINFDVQNAVLFSNVTSEAAFLALSDAGLIQQFDMEQNTSSWSQSQLYCSITFESRSKY